MNLRWIFLVIGAVGCALEPRGRMPVPRNAGVEALSQCEEAPADPPEGTRRVAARRVESSGAIPVGGTSDYVFLSTREGAPQLFRGSLQATGAAPVQLTHLSEGVPDGPGARRVISPDGKQVVFRCRTGFCRIDTAGGAHLAERPGAVGSMYQFGPFISREQPGRYYFEARWKDARGLSIYADEFESEASARLVFREPTINGWLQDVSADGRRALALDMRSHTDWALVLVDLAGGTSRQIYPKKGASARVRVAAFSRDGRRIFAGVATADDRALLVAFDSTSGEELAAHREETFPSAEIGDITEAPSGSRLALSLSAGSVDRIRLLDARTLTPDLTTRFEPPLGAGSALGFSPDGENLIVEWSTPNAPRALYLGALATGSMAPLDPPVAQSLPLAVDVSIETIASFDGTPLSTNIYRPRSTRPGRVPVVVHLACGPNNMAKLERSELTDAFLERGYAVVEPNVRGSAGFGRAFELLDDGPKRPESLEDIAAVARWLGRQSWVDADRLLLAGASYSGYQVLMSLTSHPELWRGGIDLYGITDWRSFFETTNPATAAMYMKEVGSPVTDGAFLDSISPLRRVDRLRAPVFIVHGREDRQVPVAQSEAFIAAAVERGVPVSALLMPGEGHGVERAESRQRLNAELRCFLREVLR